MNKTLGNFIAIYIYMCVCVCVCVCVCACVRVSGDSGRRASRVQLETFSPNKSFFLDFGQNQHPDSNNHELLFQLTKSFHLDSNDHEDLQRFSVLSKKEWQF